MKNLTYKSLGMSQEGQMRKIVQVLLSSSSQPPQKLEECRSSFQRLLQSPHILQKLSYDDGIIGVGCGLLLLYNHGILDNDFMPLIYKIDSIIMKIIDERLLSNPSLGSGICGVGYYLYLRCKDLDIQHCNNLNELTIAQYIIFFIDWLSESVNGEMDCSSSSQDIICLIERLLCLGLLKDELQILQKHLHVKGLTQKHSDPYPF